MTFSKAITILLLSLALTLSACGGGKGGGSVTGDSRLSEQQDLDRQLTMDMQVNPDSILEVIDSLQTVGRLLPPVADYERGTCYALMEKRRIAEYYYRKVTEDDQLFRLWPDAYYRAATNLAMILAGKNDDQGAITVAAKALEMMDEDARAHSRWYPALLFSIGNSQVIQGYRYEGIRKLLESGHAIKAIATDDPSTVNLRTWATIASNIATAVSNMADEDLEPWIAEAEEAVRRYGESSEAFSPHVVMLRGRLASLKAVYYARKGLLKKGDEAYRQYMGTDYGKLPQTCSEQLTFLEKAGRWEEAVGLLPQFFRLQRQMGLNYDLDFLKDLSTGYHIYRQAHHDGEALATADRLYHVIDSVRRFVHQDAAAELAVIYETQKKNDEIEHQQMIMRLQQWVMFASVLLLVVVFMLVYICYRRRAEKRLAVANDLLKKTNDKLKTANDMLYERNDQLIIANLRAEESTKMKVKFVQQISHEIRTPLNILSGFTQVLTAPDIEIHEEERAMINQNIMDNTERITQLINKLLELSDAGSTTVIEKNDTVSVETIIARAVEASGIEEARHLHFEVVTASDMHTLIITTNIYHIVRALAQLLDNAKKFTLTTVEIVNGVTERPKDHLERVRLIVDTPGDELRFIVEDTGRGVPPEEAEHIFEEFVQLNEYYEGTGVGLSLARIIARRLGGDVVLDTTYTAGARFVMTVRI